MQMTIAQALDDARLARVDARVLMCHALVVSTAYLIAHVDEKLTSVQYAAYDSLAKRRAQGEPVAYIVGSREFFSREYSVTPAVLIPRPETELLVEYALERMAADSTAHVLDLGTGSGCIAISIARERPLAHVVAVDNSADAVAMTRKNAHRHQVSNIEIKLSNWFSALEDRRFDVIVSNPPYVADRDAHLNHGDLRFEPSSALRGGDDGLDSVRTIIAAAPGYLAARGVLAIEHGYDQVAAVHAHLQSSGFADIFTRKDLAGIERISGGKSTAAA